MKIFKIISYVIVSALGGVLITFLLMFLFGLNRGEESLEEFYLLFLFGLPVISLIIFVLINRLFRPQVVSGETVNIQEANTQKVGLAWKILQVSFSLIVSFIGTFVVSDLSPFFGDSWVIGVILYPALFVSIFTFFYWLIDRFILKKH